MKRDLMESVNSCFIDERIDVFFEMFSESPPAYIEKLEEEAIRNSVPIIKRSTRNLLRYLIRTKRPKRILEIGTAIGYSALFMKEYLEVDSTITTIEKVTARMKEATSNFKKFDTNNQIILLYGDAVDVLEELAKKGEKFDFIFMDAAKGQYLNFLPHVMSLLNENGTLVSDNILHEGDILESRYAVKRRDRTIHSRMRAYLSKISSHPCLETICLPIGDGVAVSEMLR